MKQNPHTNQTNPKQNPHTNQRKTKQTHKKKKETHRKPQSLYDSDLVEREKQRGQRGRKELRETNLAARKRERSIDY